MQGNSKVNNKPFFCSACLRPSFAPKDSIGRESFNCRWCKATSRERAMLLQIHYQYFLKKTRKPFHRVSILGVSDGDLIAGVLKKIYWKKYANYHFHLEPKLDITNVPFNLNETADIVSCSEVLEHVQPPINRAFRGLYSLLKKNGVLILSVPHNDKFGVHIEHFPVMTSSELIISEKPILTGYDLNGNFQEFRELVFHGGIGSTLEYRVFSEVSLEEHLVVYFRDLRKINNSEFFGITWEPWSRVWLGVKGYSIE